MKDQLATLSATLFQDVILPLLGIVATWAGVHLQALLKARVKNERVQGALSRLATITVASVKEVEQTFLSELNTVTSADLEKARNAAVAKIRSHVGPRGLEELKGVMGYDEGSDVDRLIVTTLESTVHDLKNAGQLPHETGVST